MLHFTKINYTMSESEPRYRYLAKFKLKTSGLQLIDLFTSMILLSKVKRIASISHEDMVMAFNELNIFFQTLQLFLEI